MIVSNLLNFNIVLMLLASIVLCISAFLSKKLSIIFSSVLNTAILFYGLIHELTICNGTVYVCGIIVMLVMYFCMQYDNNFRQEVFSILTILTAATALMLKQQGNLIYTYILIELTSIASVCFIAILSNGKNVTEGSIKYLMNSAFGSIIMLFGIAALYLHSGSFDIDAMRSISEAGTICLILGLLIKIGIAPFHLWVPDVYVSGSFGALSVVNSIPKLCLILGLYNIHNALAGKIGHFLDIIIWITIFSIIFGSIRCVIQKSVKRILAYSSIVNMSIVVGGIFFGLSVQLLLMYMCGYIIASSIFILCGVYIYKEHHSNFSTSDVLSGRGYEKVFAAIGIFALLGMPPAIGFFAKINVILSLLSSSFGILYAIVMLFATLLGAYYYTSLVVPYCNFDHDASDNDKYRSNVMCRTYLFILCAALFLSSLFYI